MKLHELQTGDIIAVKSNGWLARKIQYFMKVQAKRKYKTTLPKYYNHTLTVYQNPKVAEAVARGFVVQDILSHYDISELKNMIVFRLKGGLNKTEKSRLKNNVLDMAYKNIEYEVLNFLWWIPYIFSNGKIDLSPKGDKQKKKIFCFETSIMLLNSARTNLFKQPDKVTTVDLCMDERFEQYYFD